MNPEEKLNNRINNVLLIKDQMKLINDLQYSINFKIPCNTNTGYDFCKLNQLPVKINFPEDLKNSKDQTLHTALAELQEKWEETIQDFMSALDKKVAVMYQDRLPVRQN